MKKMILTFVLLLGLVACKALEADSSELKVVLRNEITVTNEGTKSEGSIGKLKLGDYYLPECFTFVTDSEKTYSFIVNNHMWGQHKYFPLEKRTVHGESNFKITKEILNKGYYEGNKKLKGTPGNWLYVQWNNGAAYVDSTKLESIMAKKPFSTLTILDSIDSVLGLIKK